LSIGQGDVDTVLGVLDAHVSPSDMAELRRIVGEIEHRIARMQDKPFGDPPPPAPSPLRYFRKTPEACS
jgi:hypothetical protein